MGTVCWISCVASSPRCSSRSPRRRRPPPSRASACRAIDLDLKGASLHDVFRLLSDVGRINVVVGDDVKGAVTLRLKRVPWDQALCTIARTRQLRVTADGNVYLVTSLATRP
ncbi:MAG: hypothetical protein K8M05_09575 [Deltaproteobacteria bacterium]|nr:hypothetical protein [Kofleriaceae bacterium]